MLREEEKDPASVGSWKSFSRSVSWTERPPRKSHSKPPWNSKARACLPPLQPLSIVRSNIENWPKAGSDDLGIWPPNPPPTPGSMTPRGNLTSEHPPREFDFQREKLAFFDKECSRVLEHVYLGSQAVAKDREILRQNGITHVLNCVGFVCPEYFRSELVYKTLWLQDCPTEDITSILYDVFDYFEDVREQGKHVLVHCCQGVSRSTSLVIAYLMWKEGQSFDDAYQLVKAARGVTNPNVGFACQLLQCQKRVHALPSSPMSLLRMYRMAPHSSYDPLHLVPKMLCAPGEWSLDSRGAFIILIPCALYVWSGKHCSQVMSDNAMAAAAQFIRYEMAKGPVIIAKEGEESCEFWDAFNYGKGLTDGRFVKSEEQNRLVEPDMVPIPAPPCLNQRKRSEYDLDFDIFHRALGGGVVPPFPLSEAGSETNLPARENDWNRLRRKYASNIVKELITSSKLNHSALETCNAPDSIDICKKIDDLVSRPIFQLPLNGKCLSPESFISCSTSSSLESNHKDLRPLYYSSSSCSPSSNKPNPSSVSPSTSGFSGSFIFSPSSSNCSDSSSASAQPSPDAPVS